jgi:hypothetical protein
MPVPQRLVRPHGLGLEVRNGVGDEPLLPELGERHAARIHQAELPQPTQPADLGVERIGVSLAAERLGAVPAMFVAPADAPDLGAVTPSHLLNAHASPLSTVRSTDRKLPAGAGLRENLP